jgi:thiamine biosynthesis protein ThiS
MLLHINGEPRDFPDGLTVAGLVAHLGMKPDRVAVELNLEIVPRANWEATPLKADDKLEIVHFVGGGSGAELSKDLSMEAAAESGPPALNSDAWTCPTCGETAGRGFCPNCGEKKPSKDDFSMHHFFSHALGEFFHFDSKIFRTCRLFFTKPGFLTAEYVRGCRKRYLHPFQLFFIANLVYFLVQPYIGWTGLRTTLFVQTHMMSYSALASRMVAARIAAEGVTLQQFSQSFDHVVDVQARSLAMIMVPLFALVLAVLQWRKRQFFGQHLVFSLHFTGFFLTAVLIGVYGAASLAYRFALRRGSLIPQLNSDNFISAFAFLLLAIYTTLALRAVYRDSVLVSLAKAVAITISVHYVLDVYRFILFLTALYSS